MIRQKGTSIFGPQGGDVIVYFDNDGTNPFKDSNITSNHTRNIIVNTTSTASIVLPENGLTIYATDISGSVYLNCDGACGKDWTIYCPTNIGTDCIINCNNNNIANACSGMQVYGRHGTRDIKFSVTPLLPFAHCHPSKNKNKNKKEIKRERD